MRDYFYANRFLFYVFGIIAFFIFSYVLLFSPPSNFPAGTTLKISEGDSLHSVSYKLKADHIIRSRTVFEAFVILFGSELRVRTADYYFENKLPVYEIARRISRGQHNMAPVVATIPEGFDTGQIADAFTSKLSNFSKDRFLSEAKSLEGYLFPDTYFFLSTDTEMDVIKSMRENFDKKILLLKPAIALSKKSEKEIITMASLIEREGKGEIRGQTDRVFISGILWKRLSMNMPLQVDAAPSTYKSRGLPEAPIANPGLESIKAALYPKSSPYLYYLHDKNGLIHYAKSFSEHRQNILKYLK
ncbi:hypothetical protein A2W67_03790 [Candidatus Nomurabacteria bacterium RIFCSPLOWO2_02_40_28]|uniref:Aminodeoxychorismate lyase n=2 Tax=Candidatus Nomuraibacteriota TaxID=1752729 RepID=A0A837HWT3_9BACT|nr:MAG: Aminodeoxychorismate lyase [Candidatus Nomurabacteria bacterium GW2011_GWD2_39_12]KKR20868.1 MAG: Aminodeoxychorismate lyase [Candidatus Nomurabacteria bacterium GW2011_GWC2_39_41]KKR36392.1 MAG: Aminodeoxychorismate lyase [Candidatus Nomurabacteria bacterium GW2011_GWE2_40_10]KKR38817.1 MAG: Aminodeoxychorismate lyase [Candidatus Nomurabacteria bacterium GW2011_GWB1_40_11]KKR40015.1 MAG: Aminodeoxychorismate lyase [Parcubacteria group bacterium GW2011_GWC1_40_11]KKR59204.1 MAG: Aminod